MPEMNRKAIICPYVVELAWTMRKTLHRKMLIARYFESGNLVRSRFPGTAQTSQPLVR
jgi:hypothetical protein